MNTSLDCKEFFPIITRHYSLNSAGSMTRVDIILSDIETYDRNE